MFIGGFHRGLYYHFNFSKLILYTVKVISKSHINTKYGFYKIKRALTQYKSALANTVPLTLTKQTCTQIQRGLSLGGFTKEITYVLRYLIYFSLLVHHQEYGGVIFTKNFVVSYEISKSFAQIAIAVIPDCRLTSMLH